MKKMLRKPVAAFGIVLSLFVLFFIGCQKKDNVLKSPEEIKKPETTSIIGGGPVNISEIPYQARVFTASSGAAGVIIGERWILTAAHVVENLLPSAFTIYVGSSNINSGSSYAVDAIYSHENFTRTVVGNGTIFDNDIALLHLSTPITFGPNVQPIRYYNAGATLSINQMGTASGWGQTTYLGLDTTDHSTVLKSVDISITNLSDPSKIVAGSASGPYTNDGICFGDSGGPFTVNDSQHGKVLVGISSRADCSYGISEFTNVAYYAGWIMGKTGIHYMSIEGPSSFCSSATYTLNNLPTGATVSWSTSPSVSFTPNGNQVTVSSVGSPGNITLTATITVNNSQPVVVTKNIVTNGVYAQGVYISGPQTVAANASQYFYHLVVPVGVVATNIVWKIPQFYALNGWQILGGQGTPDVHIKTGTQAAVIEAEYTDMCGVTRTEHIGIAISNKVIPPVQP